MQGHPLAHHQNVVSNNSHLLIMLTNNYSDLYDSIKLKTAKVERNDEKRHFISSLLAPFTLNSL